MTNGIKGQNQFFAIVEGVCISESMAKEALEITAQLRREAEAKTRAELPAQKHLQVRTYNGPVGREPYLLLDPAKVRRALSDLASRQANDPSPFMLTLHRSGAMHFDHAEPFNSTDRPAEMRAL